MAEDPTPSEEQRTPLIGWLVRPAMSEDLVVELRAAKPGEIAEGALDAPISGLTDEDPAVIVCGMLGSCDTFVPRPSDPDPCPNLHSCNQYGEA